MADRLLEDNLTEADASAKAAEYNEKYPHDDWFAKAVADDYKLWGGMAEFV